MTKEQEQEITTLISQVCLRVRDIKEEVNNEQASRDFINFAIAATEDVLTELDELWERIMREGKEHFSEWKVE